MLTPFPGCGSASAPQVFKAPGASIAPGYVLAPLYSLFKDKTTSGKVVLIDQGGTIVHSWATDYAPLRAILLSDGSILVSVVAPSDEPSEIRYTGLTGELEKIDWKGNVLWKYKDPLMTHDFMLLPDGSIAYTRWDTVPVWFKQKVPGGISVGTTTMWGSELIVLDQNRNISWDWRADEHIDPALYPLNEGVPRYDWGHLNSVDYTADNPITHTPAFLVSVRNIDEVFLVDAKSGNVIWASPKGEYSLQHDATLLPSGNILVFDNGLFRPDGRSILLSQVVELDPRTDKEVWRYGGSDSLADQAQFASSIMGGAQRLPNGNTLITLSATGRIEEVTPDKKLVWEYSNTFLDDTGTGRTLFKVRKYDPQGTEWGKYLGYSFVSACSF